MSQYHFAVLVLSEQNSLDNIFCITWKMCIRIKSVFTAEDEQIIIS